MKERQVQKMPKINVLDKHVAELIAAGEVVERPSSVIKELVENSIDAGASIVTVEIRRGGVTYMRVTDNGCGIDREDVATAFLRHATSKVHDKEDLDAILTLGFRGEALASISAVSHVDLITKTPDSTVGTHYSASGGSDVAVEDAGCPNGTTITVRDIFYNVPARMKFLKKDTAEGNAVAGLLDKIALSHPEISFRLIRDGKETLHTPGDGKLVSAIYAVFGKEFSSNLLPVDYTFGGIRVHGYVSSPLGSRPNRSMQNFFINGRFVRSRTAAVALEEAYKGSIMVGKFPACVLTLTMPCGMVDVNVHPAKIEVRFVSEKAVFDAVYFAVKSAIAAGARIAPDPAQEPEKTAHVEPLPAAEPAAPQKGRQGKINPLAQFAEREGEQQSLLNAVSAQPLPPEELSRGEVPQSPPLPAVQQVSDAAPAYTASRPMLRIVSRPEAEEEPESPPLPDAPPPAPRKSYRIRVLGELFFTYILAQIDETFAIIDKHAAHERILYNRLKESQDGLDRQYLLTSVTVTLSRAEHEAVLERREALSRLGFAVEDFGGNAVVLRAIPAVAAGCGPRELFLEAVEAVSSMRRQELPAVVEEVLHRIACRSAVKANDVNNMEELRKLVETVCIDENVRFCPHGRPVILQFSRADIEKMFGRIQ